MREQGVRGSGVASAIDDGGQRDRRVGAFRSAAETTKQVDRAYEVRERIRVHLSHDTRPVDLHRLLAHPELGGDLLVEAAGDDAVADLVLSRRERLVAAADGGNLVGLLQSSALAC